MSLFSSVKRAVKRVLHPLTPSGEGPDPARADEARRRLRAIEQRTAATDRAVAKLAAQIERQGADVARDARTEQTRTRAALSRTRDELESARRELRRQSRLTGRVLQRAAREGELDRQAAGVETRIARLAEGDGPVLVGPWTGEVGFELLYWVPFVRWALERAKIDPARVVILTRGGAACWYALPGARALDVFALVGSDEFRARTASRRKQRGLGAFDRYLVRAARQRLSLGRCGVLHPALMYEMFYPVWKQHATMRRLDAYTRHERLAPPPLPEGIMLPSSFVAARFYFSDCFPDTPANRAIAGSLVERLAQAGDVVVLGSGASLDDHCDWLPAPSDRLHVIPMPSVATNLASQTAVMARARAFVGTYGGFAYLAPLLGIDALGLYSERTFFTHHLDYADAVFSRVRGGRLSALDAALAPLVTGAVAPDGKQSL